MTAATLAETARRLIAKHGRAVDMRRLSVTPQDANKPWRQADPTIDDTIVTGVFAAMFDFELKEVDGESVRRGDKRAYVAHAQFNTDLTPYTEVIDGADTWRVVNCEALQPGTTRFIYEMQLRK